MDDRKSTSKIAIPKLQKLDHDERARRKPLRLARAQRACDHCRKRKVKCTGEQPHCKNCVDQRVPCNYSLARRDRLKEATAQNSRLVALLKGLGNHVDDKGLKMIEEYLDQIGQSVPGLPGETSGEKSRESTPSEDGQGDDPGTEADDGDFLDEDLLRSRESRATGFVGSNSSVQWLRSLKTDAAAQQAEASLPHRTRQETSNPADILHVSDSTFYLDRDDLQLEIMVDPYALPPSEAAEQMFNCYMQTVHTSFPILPNGFEEQFRRYNESVRQGRPYEVPEEWQATLNLVLAIGAHYSQLLQAGWRAGEQDHLVFMTRATRILRLDKIATTLPAPSLMFIQALGLLSLYYLTIGQVSRAWMIIGISLRFALAAGLHLRNNDPSALPSKKETLIRTWWSLHSIESLLCAIIGRPCIIPNDECTVPLPQPTPAEGSVGSGSSRSKASTSTSNRGDSTTVARSSFLGARVTIALITQKALSKLYSPQMTVDSWLRIQSDIASLISELDDWAVAAHLAGLSTTDTIKESTAQREKLLLSFNYYSAKLLICRPCLCHLERSSKGQSDLSAGFNQRTAEACIQAAVAMADLFTDRPNLLFIYQQSPWWCTVHNIMQAVAVLLLKMSFGSTHATHDGKDLSDSVKKFVHWLHLMSVSNAVAERAHKVILDIIKISAPRIQIDISDILIGDFPQQDYSQPFQPFSRSTNTGYGSHTGNYSSQNEWAQPSNYPSTTDGAGFEPPTTKDFDKDHFDPNFLLDAGLETPPIFGNPFLTNFDEPNFLISAFSSGTRDVNMDDVMAPYPNFEHSPK